MRKVLITACAFLATTSAFGQEANPPKDLVSLPGLCGIQVAAREAEYAGYRKNWWNTKLEIDAQNEARNQLPAMVSDAYRKIYAEFQRRLTAEDRRVLAEINQEIQAIDKLSNGDNYIPSEAGHLMVQSKLTPGSSVMKKLALAIGHVTGIAPRFSNQESGRIFVSIPYSFTGSDGKVREIRGSVDFRLWGRSDGKNPKAITFNMDALFDAPRDLEKYFITNRNQKGNWPGFYASSTLEEVGSNFRGDATLNDDDFRKKHAEFLQARVSSGYSVCELLRAKGIPLQGVSTATTAAQADAASGGSSAAVDSSGAAQAAR